MYTKFCDYLKTIILDNPNIGKFYSKKHPNSKYSLDNILNDILYVLKTGISWRDLKSSIKWNTVYFHFKRFSKFNIFKHIFLKFRNIYFSNNNTNIQLIDSTFVMNKYGKTDVARNIWFKNKKCNKVSLLTDSKGVPLSVLVKSGNIHDIHFVEQHINDVHLLNTSNKIKLLADKAYESKHLRSKIKTFNYFMMIPKKSNAKITYPFNKNTYKKRIFVEHSFQKLKNFRRISTRYDSLLSSYFTFLYLALSQILFKKISIY